MSTLLACIKKDINEFVRYRKNIICMVLLITISAMVLIVTNTFPILLAQLSMKSPNLISDPNALDGMFDKTFPTNVKGSMGIVAADIGIFYTIVAALMCHSLIPSEIREGKWILLVNAGITGRNLMASKCIVYSVNMALPVFVISNLYYYVASFFLENNMLWSEALLNSLVLAFSMACIVALTIMTSVIYKKSIFAALSVIVVVLTAPDILSMFSFGRWFPTYLLTFTYSAESNITLLIIPIFEMLLIIVGCFVLASRKCEKLEVCR